MPKPNRETNDAASTAASGLLNAARGRKRDVFFAFFRGSDTVTYLDVTAEVLKVAGSALSQDQTPGKRRAKKRAKRKGSIRGR